VKLFLWAKVVYTTMFLSDMFSLVVTNTWWWRHGDGWQTVLGRTWQRHCGHVDGTGWTGHGGELVGIARTGQGQDSGGDETVWCDWQRQSPTLLTKPTDVQLLFCATGWPRLPVGGGIHGVD
jgi:hypothetical protein